MLGMKLKAASQQPAIVVTAISIRIEIWATRFNSSRGITAVITEPERLISLLIRTRKSGFACITLILIMASLGE
jgi:hypothetical protein